MSGGPDAGPDIETELDRDIGLLGAIAIGVGTMIAAGIFVLSGLAVSNVGAAAIVSFLAAAIVASFTAFAYAEFASIYPESGGGYMYVANVFDRDWTYIVGWSMILGYPASAAFYLASFSDWFAEFIYPLLDPAMPWVDLTSALPFWVSGLFVLVLLVGVNLKGTEETGLFQVVVTALKVVLILLFLVGGLQAFEGSVVLDSLADNTGGFSDLRNIGLTSALVFITFFGFEAIATNAEEIESPSRTVPRAIFISMGLVTVIYTLVVLVVVLAIHDEAFLRLLVRNTDATTLAEARDFVATHGELAMGFAAQYYLGDVGFYVIIVGALFSMVSAANATILAGSRVKLAMARRDHLPGQFEDLHPSLNTPYRSVLLTGGLIVLYITVFTVVFEGGHGIDLGVLTLHFGINGLTHFADFMLLGGLIVVNLAVVRSRRQSPDLDRGFEVPAVPWVPAVAVVANLVLLVNVEPSSFLLGLLAEGAGILLYVGVIGGVSRERMEREAPTVIAEHAPTENAYEVLVPVANPEHVPQLMRTARDVAAENDGEIHVMSVVELPAQTPLSEGQPYADERREVIDAAMAHAGDVPVNGTVRIAHDATDGILHTVEQYDSDVVLMGWHGGEHHRRDVVLGTTVDNVVRGASCDVLVERFGPDRTGEVEDILLPTAGGPHAEFAAEVSRAVARSEGASVTVLTIAGPDRDRDEVAEWQEQTGEILGDVAATSQVVESEDVVGAIVDETDDYDLTVIGATREGILQQFVFGAIPESVARRADSTIIMAKRNLGVTSTLRRWFRRA